MDSALDDDKQQAAAALPAHRGTVCVTGASGYIAGHLVAQLLERGYTVRGTVRSLGNADAVEYLKKLPHAAERLHLFEADLLSPGSFDTAVTGCEGVFHTASPFFTRVCTPDELVLPAREGSLNVYRSCKKAGTVMRVVTTSSFATIIFGHDHTTDPTPYTDEEWNTESKLEGGGTMDYYRVSKVEAEKAGWSFIEQQSPKFDLITLNPPLVIGPFLPHYKRANESSMILKRFVTGEMKEVPDGGMGFIDVRDLAAAHVLAYETPGAKGRYLLAGGGMTLDANTNAQLANASLTWLELAHIIKKLRPNRPVATTKAEGNALPPRFNVTKIHTDLGWTSQPLQVTLAEQIESLEEAGLLPPDQEPVAPST